MASCIYSMCIYIFKTMHSLVCIIGTGVGIGMYADGFKILFTE